MVEIKLNPYQGLKPTLQIDSLTRIKVEIKLNHYQLFTIN